MLIKSLLSTAALVLAMNVSADAAASSSGQPAQQKAAGDPKVCKYKIASPELEELRADIAAEIQGSWLTQNGNVKGKISRMDFREFCDFTTYYDPRTSTLWDHKAGAWRSRRDTNPYGTDFTTHRYTVRAEGSRVIMDILPISADSPPTDVYEVSSAAGAQNLARALAKLIAQCRTGSYSPAA